MSDCRDSGVERDAVPTFEDLWQADAQRRREQNRRFQEYISESDPSLAAALAAEAKRFEMVSRAVIEPTMRASPTRCDRAAGTRPLFRMMTWIGSPSSPHLGSDSTAVAPDLQCDWRAAQATLLRRLLRKCSELSRGNPCGIVLGRRRSRSHPGAAPRVSRGHK